MNLLAIDTAANFCSACVLDTEAGFELGRTVHDIGKGHAELLLGVIEETLRISKVGYADLGGIAVAAGPGSFTGVRVGVSAARGLALALKIPAVGVTTLEAIAEEARSAYPGRSIMAVIDARRDEFYTAAFDALGVVVHAASVTGLDEAIALAAKLRPVLAGSAAGLIANAVQPLDLDVGSTSATADIGVYARLALAKNWSEKPRPVYLREPDAKPQAGLILPRSGN
jgi:tRNA threonylcarbamoyladenosine biosynthesis protein TsaB